MMSRLSKKISLWVLRLLAALLISLALLIGVARLLLPQAARFADEVRAAAQQASGFEVDFKLLSAGMSWYGPELRLTAAKVSWPDGSTAFAADEIAVALDIYKLVTTGQTSPALVHVEGLGLAVEVAASGDVLVQGKPWQDYLANTRQRTKLTNVRIELENIRFDFRDRKRGIDPVDATLRQAFVVLDDDEVELDAEIKPDKAYGHSLELSGLLPVKLFSDPEKFADDVSWRLEIRAEDFRLDPWLKLAAIENTPVIGSQGTAQAAVAFRGRQVMAVQVEADIDELVLAQPDGKQTVYGKLAGSADWLRNAGGWEARGTDIRLAREGREWPASEFVLTYRAPGNMNERLSGSVSFLRLEDLMPMLTAFGQQQLQEAGIQGSASGDVWRATGKLERRENQIVDYALKADFEKLGYRSASPDMDIGGFSGQVNADFSGGSINFATRDARFGWNRLFRESLAISSLEGPALWRNGDDKFRLIVHDLFVTTPYGRGSTSFEFVSDYELQDPQIELTAEASMADATQVSRYLPNTLPEKVLDWVNYAVTAGRSDNTIFRLNGPLRQFPFREDQGSFYIDIDFADASLAYAPGWPALEQASGHLIFDNESLYSKKNQATVDGIRVQNVDARIDDLHAALIEIDAQGATGTDRMLAFLQDSPVAEKLGRVFADIGAAGQADARVSLQIPVRDLSNWQLQGEVELNNTSVWLAGLQPRISEIAGKLQIDRYFVTANRLTGRLMDEDVVLQIEANQDDNANFSHRASLSGEFPYARLRSELGLPDLGVIDGRTRLNAAAMFPAFRRGSQPFRLLVHSDLNGISSSLPHPLAKAADDRETFDAEVLFPEASRIDVRLNLERDLRADLDFHRVDERWRLGGGRVQMGAGAATQPGKDGLAVSAAVDRLSLSEWRDAFPDEGALRSGVAQRSGQWQDLFESAELFVGNLEILGFAFPDTDVRADFAGSRWDVELIGPWLEGRATVPYELDSSTVIEANLSRLLLIEPLEEAEDPDGDYTSSPVDAPGFKGSVGEFALGNMRLGKLDFDVVSMPNGLESRQLDVSATSFDAVLSGDWRLVDSVQRSRLHIEFSSNDLQTALNQLGFAPLLSAKQAKVTSDLLWEGGPGMKAVEASTGEVTMVIRDGFINEVSAGGGRLLGLLSVASLPRRLALDFTDLTGDKLEFSKISGNFKIDFGNAWTCNLSLEGDIADMALVGRTGLNKEDYNQVAVVRPHVSNLVPVPAAFLGGPAVGVAALLVSQIFKKPLSGIGESYYTIRGSWEDSDIRKVQRSELDTTPFADCEAQLPKLSPEEIAAIKDLATQQKALADKPQTTPAQPAINEKQQTKNARQ